MGGEQGSVVRLAARRGGLLDQLGSEESVVIRSLDLDAIESDPDQPREYFDEAELQELADSLRAEGLLQEPAVYPIALDEEGRPTRFRLLFGERRWRAARLAGWTQLRVKILPSNRDEDLIAKLKRIDQQTAENAARAALSAVEEARAIEVKLGVLREVNGIPAGALTPKKLVEQVAEERKLSVSTVYRLLDLLSAPASLRRAILERKVTGRDVAFQLASHWTALRKEYEAEAGAKREVKFREAVKAWAGEKGLELNAEALNKYAAENWLDPKMVKATIKTAEKIERAAEEQFERVVKRAVEGGWTVKDARRLLGGSRGKAKEEAGRLPLFERSEAKGRARLTIHLERLKDPEIATSAARGELARVLRSLLADLEQEAVPEVAKEAVS
jgi:ParB/RepB/Spo0J family partition protein